MAMSAAIAIDWRPSLRSYSHDSIGAHDLRGHRPTPRTGGSGRQSVGRSADQRRPPSRQRCSSKTPQPRPSEHRGSHYPKNKLWTTTHETPPRAWPRARPRGARMLRGEEFTAAPSTPDPPWRSLPVDAARRSPESRQRVRQAYEYKRRKAARVRAYRHRYTQGTQDTQDTQDTDKTTDTKTRTDIDTETETDTNTQTHLNTHEDTDTETEKRRKRQTQAHTHAHAHSHTQNTKQIRHRHTNTYRHI